MSAVERHRRAAARQGRDVRGRRRAARASREGDGPVDATFKAIESLAESGAELLLYSVNTVTQGTESQGEVTVRLSKAGRIVNGVGADTDIVVASAKAYINALNKLARSRAHEPAARVALGTVRTGGRDPLCRFVSAGPPTHLVIELPVPGPATRVCRPA